MPDLVVPTPTLKFEATDSGLALMEKPLEVKCAAPTFPEGSAFGQADLGKAGFFVVRQQTSGSVAEVWDDATKEWQPESGADPASLQVQPLIFKAGDPLPWQGLLVAAGQKDKNGTAQFDKASGGLPRYWMRAYFSGKRAEQTLSGLSTASASVQFVSMMDAMRAGLGIVPQDPMQATQVQVFLRNASLQVIGSIDIRASGNTAEIEIANRDSTGARIAAVRLMNTGEIRLEPAPGQKVIVAGDLEAERITYRPGGGGVKQML